MSKCKRWLTLAFQSTFPRGERQDQIKYNAEKENFNPRSHVGNDHFCIHFLSTNHNFNPRSHVGNDRQQKPHLLSLHDFNPRSHVGNDQPRHSQRSVPGISIHVPTWGTTRTSTQHKHPQDRFQSTFPRGERLCVDRLSQILRVFQSTFPRGERRVTLCDI